MCKCAERAKELLNDGIIQVICLLDHGLLPRKEHEIGKEYVLTRTAQMYGFTAMIGHADDGAIGGASMVLVRNGEIKVKPSTHPTRVSLVDNG